MQPEPVAVNEPDERLCSLLLDHLEAAERGTPRDADTLVANHPELARELRDFLDTWVRVEGLTAPIRSASQILRDFALSRAQLPQGPGQPANTYVPAPDEPGLIGSRVNRSASTSPESNEQDGGWLARWLLRHPPLSAEHYPFLTVSPTIGEIGRLGPYRLLEVIGSGGMGIVFRGEDVSLGRAVAVKVLRAELACDPLARERFLREARAAAALDHEHVIAVYYVGDEHGIPFLGMPWLRGMSLEELLGRAAPLEIPAVLRLGHQIALGLAAAHSRGLLHRDIKPANLWVEIPESSSGAVSAGTAAGIAGRIKILDFGLARAASDGGQLTRSGAAVGTPAYMAPEQAAGAVVDHRSDLFALGVVLYRMCTGRLPYPGRTSTNTLATSDVEPPPSARDVNPGVPQGLSDLVMELLAEDPARRPASAAEVADRLQDLKGRGAAMAKAAVALPAQTTVKPSSSWRALGAGAILALAVLVPLCYLFGGAVIRFATNRGEVVIVVDDPDAKVTVTEGGAEIQDRKGQRTITLAAGEHELQVTIKDLAGESRFFTKTLVLTRGGREIVNARQELNSALQTAPVPPPAGQVKPAQPTVRVEDTDPVRRAAEWVLAQGGKLRVYGINGKQEVAAVTDLPAGAFRVVAIDLGGSATDDAGLAHVAALGDLETLDLRSTRVGDAGLIHLKGLRKLWGINVNSTSVGDSGLAELTPLPELRSIELGNTRVSDSGVKQLKSLPKLRSLGLFGTSVTDEGLSTIATTTRLESLDLGNTRVSDSGLASALEGLADLRSLGLGNGRATDEIVRRLHSLPKLEVLSLNGTKITDAGLANFQYSASLRDVDLSTTQVSDAGIASLAAVKTLHSLTLARTRVSDAGLMHLAQAKDLAGIDLAFTQVSDAGLAHLARMTKLQSLYLTGTRVTDAGLAKLEGLSDLKLLNLARTRTTDAGLAHFGGMKQLRMLYLSGTRVTDGGLTHLLSLPLPPLTVLDLSGARVSATGAAAVKGLFPKAQVEWWEPNYRAAQAVLAAGGFVDIRSKVEGPGVPVKSVGDLPGDYFRLTRARLAEGRKPSAELLGMLAALCDPDFDDFNELDLTGSTVGDADLEALAPLPCRRLVLDRCPVAGQGLVRLKQLPRLRELSLGCQSLSFLGVRFVGELKQLEKLSLANSGATDASLSGLRGLVHLRELDLTGTKVSEHGVAELQKSLPKCDIKAGPAKER
jgi:serine/threonine protein kinase/Leucine-rich repeat (LRR) protein